jgi:hypothetical protein
VQFGKNLGVAPITGVCISPHPHTSFVPNQNKGILNKTNPATNSKEKRLSQKEKRQAFFKKVENRKVEVSKKLEVQSSFTSRFCQSSDTTVVQVSASIKDDILNAFFLSPFGNGATHHTSGLNIRSAFDGFTKVLINRTCRSQGD